MEKSRESVATSSRLLPDFPCKVCSDHSSGKHYGVYACDGCAGFFKRSVRRRRSYDCKSRSHPGACAVDKTHRNQCRACRLRRCLHAGMNEDAVQHERGPRHSTLRRQLVVSLREQCPKSSTSASAAAADAADAAVAVASSSSSSPSSPFQCISPHLFVVAAAAAAAGGGRGGVGLSGLFQELGDVMPVGVILAPSSFVHHPMPKYANEMTSSRTGSTEATLEQAARVLFRVIRWVKRVQSLAGLSVPDQLLLLSERWTRLFVLTAAEAQMVVEPTPLLLRAAGIPVADNASTSASDVECPTTVSEVRLLQETVLRFQALHVDPIEYACLRGIVAFEPDLKAGSDEPSTPGSLTDRAAVSVLRDQAQLSLSRHIDGAYPNQPLRFGRLLLLLPSLGSISSRTIGDVFFRATIGETPMKTLIANMYQAESAANSLLLY